MWLIVILVKEKFKKKYRSKNGFPLIFEIKKEQRKIVNSDMKEYILYSLHSFIKI